MPVLTREKYEVQRRAETLICQETRRRAVRINRSDCFADRCRYPPSQDGLQACLQRLPRTGGVESARETPATRGPQRRKEDRNRGDPRTEEISGSCSAYRLVAGLVTERPSPENRGGAATFVEFSVSRGTRETVTPGSSGPFRGTSQRDPGHRRTVRPRGRRFLSCLSRESDCDPS